MQWHRVVDAVGNLCAFQLSDKGVAVVCQHCVLRVRTRVAFCDFLRSDFGDVCEKLVVLAGIFAAHFQFIVQMAELDAENCCLDGVESTVHAADFVDVSHAAPVVCNQADLLGEFIVVSE